MNEKKKDAAEEESESYQASQKLQRGRILRRDSHQSCQMPQGRWRHKRLLKLGSWATVWDTPEADPNMLPEVQAVPLRSDSREYQYEVGKWDGEGRSPKKDAFSSSLPLWATRSSSCWGTLGITSLRSISPSGSSVTAGNCSWGRRHDLPVQPNMQVDRMSQCPEQALRQTDAGTARRESGQNAMTWVGEGHERPPACLPRHVASLSAPQCPHL